MFIDVQCSFTFQILFVACYVAARLGPGLIRIEKPKPAATWTYRKPSGNSGTCTGLKSSQSMTKCPGQSLWWTVLHTASTQLMEGWIWKYVWIPVPDLNRPLMGGNTDARKSCSKWSSVATSWQPVLWGCAIKSSLALPFAAATKGHLSRGGRNGHQRTKASWFYRGILYPSPFPLPLHCPSLQKICLSENERYPRNGRWNRENEVVVILIHYFQANPDIFPSVIASRFSQRTAWPSSRSNSVWLMPADAPM